MGLSYRGRGEFIPGVPARDLSADEVRRFRAAIDEHQRNTGRALYGSANPSVTTESAEAAASAEDAPTTSAGATRRGVKREPTDGE